MTAFDSCEEGNLSDSSESAGAADIASRAFKCLHKEGFYEIAHVKRTYMPMGILFEINGLVSGSL